ncbi:hypothetical protein [Oricola thermophila]|uniref:O-antigen ligase family protein n=1 Tax=Oricola thermophila TaxID=2742145 RepID=A0A6N1VG42_9HYPH|nr:hypothetical protein [Oricola thermophila]QKV17937.1 hypothetical protein HTY61_05415 [Oricola thermophila]
MEFSVAGAIVIAVLLMLLAFLRAGFLAGLVGSQALGATAIVSLPSLGGASPVVSVVFTLAFLATSFLRADIFRRLGAIFSNIRTAWIVLAFMIYSGFSAIVFPRLFAGSTNVFVASRERDGVFETTLAPVSGNISQAGYLLFSGLTFFAVCLLLLRRFRLEGVLRGFFLFAWLNAVLGMIDMIGKYSGLGDVLAPIRTANYALLTDVELAGFARLAGGFSEASAFGAASLACLAFAYTYWRRRRTRQSFWLTAITFFLLLASTSTTAYAGLAILCIPVAFSMLRQLAARRTRQTDLLVIAVFLAFVTGLMTLAVVRPQTLVPVVDLVDSAILAKTSSDSGQERAYWNAKSLQSLSDTAGLGVGLGSSRASSWPIAVISQLGVAGLFLMTIQIVVLARGMRGLPGRLEPDGETAVASIRACALAGIVSTSLIGGNADPGTIFYVALSVIAVSRVYVAENARLSDAEAKRKTGWRPVCRPDSTIVPWARPAG